MRQRLLLVMGIIFPPTSLLEQLTPIPPRPRIVEACLFFSFRMLLDPTPPVNEDKSLMRKQTCGLLRMVLRTLKTGLDLGGNRLALCSNHYL